MQWYYRPLINRTEARFAATRIVSLFAILLVVRLIIYWFSGSPISWDVVPSAVAFVSVGTLLASMRFVELARLGSPKGISVSSNEFFLDTTTVGRNKKVYSFQLNSIRRATISKYRYSVFDTGSMLNRPSRNPSESQPYHRSHLTHETAHVVVEYRDEQQRVGFAELNIGAGFERRLELLDLLTRHPGIVYRIGHTEVTREQFMEELAVAEGVQQ